MTVKRYSAARDGNNYLSEHFKVSEFACKNGADEVLIDDTLVCLLEVLRKRYNKAVTINSGYRTETYNISVGGVSGSKHCKGMAADIVVKGVSPANVYSYLNTVMNTWGGLILYRTQKFVHVDTRAQKYREEK